MKTMTLRLCVVGLLALFAQGCMHQVIHQGNVIKEDKMVQIAKGMTRFEVESLLGTPAIVDPLHENIVHYVEEYQDPETGESYLRNIDIKYSNSLRVESISQRGFKKN